MKLKLAYGKTGLPIELPDEWKVDIVEPVFQPGLSDPLEKLRQSLERPLGTQPLRELINPDDLIGIIINDLTRATPNPTILAALLEHLNFVPEDHIRLFIALGTHRRMNESELAQTLGAEIVERYQIIQNDAFDSGTQVKLGVTNQGHEIWINKDLMDCQVKILTGFIEPHFFAGFSGGGKAIMPGMAGLETILGNHCAANISHPKATWGITRSNPIWEEVREVARLANATFLVNVTLNRDQGITGVFSGDLDQAHAAGVNFTRQTAMVPVEAPFDIVVTSNAGFPLDLNLYQAVKGMSAASQIVKDGGTIILAAACWDGIPDHGHFKKLLETSATPGELLQRIMQPGFKLQDQWEAQVQAQIQQKAKVYLYNDHISDEQVRAVMLHPTHDIIATIRQEMQLIKNHPRICILPEGPQTIPYIQQT